LFAGCQHFCLISNGAPLCWLSKLQTLADDIAKNCGCYASLCTPRNAFLLILEDFMAIYANTVNNYADQQARELPLLWIKRLTKHR